MDWREQQGVCLKSWEDQPREPGGKREGGRWVESGRSEGSGDSAAPIKTPQVGSTVTADGARYAIESTDSDDAFPPAVASYEVKEGYLFYHGRDGSEGIVSGSPDEIANWVRSVDKEVRERPPEDEKTKPWEPADGGAELIDRARESGLKAAEAFGIPAPELKFETRKAEYGIGGEAGHGDVTVVNAHKDLPASFDFKTPGVTRGMHFAAHEVMHIVNSANPELGKEIADRLQKINPRVSMYGSIAGANELLMETAAAYNVAPDELAKASPEAFALMKEWAQRSKKRDKGYESTNRGMGVLQLQSGSGSGSGSRPKQGRFQHAGLPSEVHGVASSARSHGDMRRSHGDALTSQSSKSWREQQQAVLEVCCTKDYHPHHLRFDAHACCFIDEESGKAWDEGVHPRVDSGEHGGEFTSGGGGGESSDKPQTPREKYDAEVARIDAEHAKVMEKHAEAVKAHEAAVEAIDAKHAEEVQAWEKRGEARDARRERIDETDPEADDFKAIQDNVGTAFEDFDTEPETWEKTAANITAHAAGYAADWQASYGPDGLLAKKMQAAGFPEEGMAKVAAVAEKSHAAIVKAAEKIGKAAQAKVAAEKAMEGLSEPEPPDDLPDEGVTSEMQAAYDKASAKYDKDSDRWEKLNEKLSEADDKLAESQSDIDEVFEAQSEKISTAVDRLHTQAHKEVDKEEKDDDEPEEPELPDEPEEPEQPDYPDEPEEDESDTRWPAKETEGKSWRAQQIVLAKAWESGKHPRGGDYKNPGRFSSGAGGGTVDEPTKRPEPSAIPPTRATGGVVRPPQESQTPKTPQPASTADRSPLHHAMEKAPLKHADVLKGGANATSLLTLEDGTKAVFKTPDGEDPEAGREGVPLGTQYRREIAASRVADALGFGDLVPATTVRDQGGDVGSVQAFVDYAYNPSQFDNPFDGPKGAARAAVFDYLVGHLDRHQGNWLLKGGKLFLIDNGLSFPDAYHTDDFFNMEFWRHVQQEDLPMPDVSALAGKWPAVEKELRDSGIEDAAIKLAKTRFDAVVDGGKEYVAELPSLLGEEGGPTLGDMAQYYSRRARKDRHNAMVAEKERVFLEERKRAREARRAAAAERGS